MRAEHIVNEMNERAISYVRQGLSIDAAIQQAVTDYVSQLKGVVYKIMSYEDIERLQRLKFFEPLAASV
jgi:hypothetical protein